MLENADQNNSDTFHAVDFPQGFLVFINQNLLYYYKCPWSLCKRLHSKKMTHSFWVFNGIDCLKVRGNTPVLLLTHDGDLEKPFDNKEFVED